MYHPPTKSTVHVRKNIGGNISIFYHDILVEYTIVRR
jgi:hypothetical protein